MPSTKVDIMELSQSTHGISTEATPLLQSDKEIYEEKVEVKQTGSRWWSGSVVLANAALGAGLLNLPQAYNLSGGITPCIIIQTFLLVFIIGAMLVLAKGGLITNGHSYPDAVGHLTGTFWRMCAALTIMLLCYGANVTNLIIIGDQIDKLFNYVYGKDFCLFWYMNRRFTVPVCAVVFVLPLCFFRKIDSLKYVSVLGAISMGYVVILVAAKYLIEGPRDGVEIVTSPAVWTDAFRVIPVICFSYQCHPEVVPVVSCLKHKTWSESTKTVMAAILMCVVIYTATAIFGFLTFGDTVSGDILVSYPVDGAVMTAHILLALKSVAGYPILLYIIRTAFESFWMELAKRKAPPTEKLEKILLVSQSMVIFITTVILAVLIPGIESIIQLLGVLGVLLIFLFPGLMLLEIAHAYEHDIKRYRLTKAAGCIFIVLGAFIAGVSLMQSIIDFMSNSSSAEIEFQQCLRIPVT